MEKNRPIFATHDNANQAIWFKEAYLREEGKISSFVALSLWCKESPCALGPNGEGPCHPPTIHRAVPFQERLEGCERRPIPPQEMAHTRAMCTLQKFLTRNSKWVKFYSRKKGPPTSTKLHFQGTKTKKKVML